MALPGSYTNFTGLTVQGAVIGTVSPTANTRRNQPSGKILYVRSIGSNGDGTGIGTGVSPQEPMATLQEAITSLAGRSNMGDVIYCLPGHVESISSADYFSGGGAASYFSVIGLGNGSNLPTFNWTTATSTWLLDTAGVELSTLRLNLCGSTATGALTVATPITVSAANCRIVNCLINWGQDTDTGCGSTLGAISVTAPTFDFINNICVNLDTAGTLAVSFLSLNGADGARIFFNYIAGGTTSTTVGPVHFVTTASLNAGVIGNYIENRRASSTKALTSAIAGVTGEISYNRFFVNSGIVAITTSNLPPMYQCFTSNASAKNGALDVGAGTSA